MKRRIAALFLALAMFCLTPLSACAADSQTAISPESRSAQSEEHTDVFTDVPADARYADAIQYCYQAGLISGHLRHHFLPGEQPNPCPAGGGAPSDGESARRLRNLCFF